MAATYGSYSGKGKGKKGALDQKDLFIIAEVARTGSDTVTMTIPPLSKEHQSVFNLLQKHKGNLEEVDQALAEEGNMPPEERRRLLTNSLNALIQRGNIRLELWRFSELENKDKSKGKYGDMTMQQIAMRTGAMPAGATTTNITFNVPQIRAVEDEDRRRQVFLVNEAVQAPPRRRG